MKKSRLQIRVSNTLLLGIVTLALCAGMAQGQPIGRPVPFTLSARDTTGSSFLPHIEEGPAGKHGAWHVSSDGHYEAADGTRMRFFGTELEWSAVFLPGEVAEVVAKRLAKLGFNAVRLTNWDYWGYDDISLFRTYDDKGQIEESSYVPNPAQVTRLDTLLYELKKAGIYVFLPLDAVHRYVPGDGIPTWDSTYYNGYLMPVFYKEALAKQQQFAHWLAEHVNPLTGVQLGKDASIACIEIAQEYTVPFYWQIGRLNYIDTNNALSVGIATISYHQSRHLDTMFNTYLRQKYTNDASINAAWGGGAVSGENLMDNGSFTTFDMNRWTLTNVAPARSTSVLISPGQDNSPATMIHITGLDPAHLFYGNIFTNASVIVGKDSLYEYSFWAKIRADPEHPVVTRSIYAYMAQTETGSANIATPFDIDTVWRRYSFKFRGTYPGAQTTGVLFSGDYGDVMLDNFAVKHLPETGLRAGESLSGSMIQRLPFSEMNLVSAARARDLVTFYLDLERTYFDAITRTLRDTLHVAALVNRSQTGYWATLPDYYALKDAEVTASHQGWDYVSALPDVAYSDSDWMVRNIPMVADPAFGALSLAAASAVAGKAHVVSWSTPNVNQSSASEALLPPTYASLQDWDGLFLGPYAITRTEVLADTIIPGYLSSTWNDIVANHAMMALVPAASYVFRSGSVARASVTDTMRHDASDVFLFPHYADYRGPYGQDGFQYGDQGITTYLKVRQSFDSPVHQLAAENYYTPGDSLNRSETGEISYAPGILEFRVSTPTVYGYTGYPSAEIDFPTLAVRRLDNSQDALSFYYLRDTIRHTGFFSVATRTQNTGMVWRDSLSYGNHYGHAPTILSAARLQLRIESNFDQVTIQPLDSAGHPAGQPIPATANGTGGFTATLDQLEHPSVWFMIQETSTQSVSADAHDGPELHILANPVSTRLQLVASDGLPTLHLQALEIYDAIGRLVYTTEQPASRTSVDVRGMAEGTYTVVGRWADGQTVRKRFTVIH
jgi:hypothetical protein